MLALPPSRPGRNQPRRRHWLSGAVTLLAALAAVIGLAGLQAPGALASMARGAAASAGAAAHDSAAAAAHAAPASRSHAAHTAASPRNLRSSFASTVPKGGKIHRKVIVGHSVKNDVSPKLRNIKPVKTQRKKVIPALPIIHPHATRAGPAVQATRDSLLQSKTNPVVQNKLAPSSMPSTLLNFDGTSYPGVNCFCAPPDTNGAVGATQYMQIVNTAIQVFNKSTGASVLGPESIETLWAGFAFMLRSLGETSFLTECPTMTLPPLLAPFATVDAKDP